MAEKLKSPRLAAVIMIAMLALAALPWALAVAAMFLLKIERPGA